MAFQGDVFKRLDAASLSKSDRDWAQDHLRILSGLYGLLRPLDLIQPYRLEMGTRLSNPRGKNLYQFWGSRLVDSLNAEHAERPTAAVLNLASNEYLKAVPIKELTPPLLTAVFQEIRDGQPKTIAFLAKKARGMMARFVVQTIDEDLVLAEDVLQRGDGIGSHVGDDVVRALRRLLALEVFQQLAAEPLEERQQDVEIGRRLDALEQLPDDVVVLLDGLFPGLIVGLDLARFLDHLASRVGLAAALRSMVDDLSILARPGRGYTRRGGRGATLRSGRPRERELSVRVPGRSGSKTHAQASVLRRNSS